MIYFYVSNIKGPANMIIDPAGHNDETGNVIIRGNLEVKGDTTTINSTTGIGIPLCWHLFLHKQHL